MRRPSSRCAPAWRRCAGDCGLTALHRRCRETRAGGDSVGGGLAVTALAALRDGRTPACAELVAAAAASDARLGAVTARLLAAPFEPPAALLLVSPAVDFSARGVFGRLAATRTRVQDAFPYDYICENEAADVAAHLLPPGTAPAAQTATLAGRFVSAAALASFAGLARSPHAGMLAVSGGAEAFAADVAGFVSRAQRAGVPSAHLHEAPGQPHCWPVLPLPRLAEAGAAVVARFVERALLGPCAGSAAG